MAPAPSSRLLLSAARRLAAAPTAGRPRAPPRVVGAAWSAGGRRHVAGATHPPRPVNERCLEYRPGSREVTVR